MLRKCENSFFECRPYPSEMLADIETTARLVCEVSANSSSFGYLFVSALTRVQSSTLFCQTTKSLYERPFFFSLLAICCLQLAVPILFAIRCSLFARHWLRRRLAVRI